jgi:peptide/nickel transport system substrate-binding protein
MFRSRKSSVLSLFLAVILLVCLLPMASVAGAVPLAQGESYTVQKDDSLWVVAEKYLGNGAAYPAIVEATNEKAAEDATFATIVNASLIQPGWKLWIPSAEEAGAFVETYEAPTGEQVLRIGMTYRTEDWSPLRGGGMSAFWLGLWWAGPMYFDSEGELHPYVFNEWDSNDDFTVWTFKIDPGAVFSDGSPITAEDVVGTWNLCAHPATKHQRVGLFLAGVEGYEEVVSGEAKEMPGLVATDSSTVEMTLTAPDPVFYQRIATNLIGPVKISQAIGPDGEEVPEWWHPKNNVVVSGPFMPESIDLDKGEVVFVPNPNFWGPKPKLDKIILITVEDAQTQITMLQNGELDASTELFTPTVVEDLGVDFLAGPLIPRCHQFWLDASREPTNDINVRKALIMAVDWKKVYDAAFPQGGFGKPSDQLLVAVPGVDPDYEPFPYDPEGAKEALAASSYGSAENLPKLFFVGISQPSHELSSQYIAEQWRQVLGIERVEMKPAYDDYSGPDQERVQIFRDDVGARFPDTVTFLMGAIHSSSGCAQGKMGGYANPEVDRLLEEAATKASDDPDRIRLAREAQRLFRDDWMYIPYVSQTLPKYAMPWVKGLEKKNFDWQVVEPWNVYIEK